MASACACATASTTGPKPMALVGERPLLWHVMRYYAHYGHTDFVLCLGYGASAVKDFFLNYDETRSNDFVLEKGAREVKLLKTDISDWRITFVDTGLQLAHRGASAPGPAATSRTSRCSWPTTRTSSPTPSARHDRALRGQQRGGEPAGRATAVLPPRGGHRRRRDDHPGHSDARPSSLGERRLLPASPGDLRRAPRRRGPGRGRPGPTGTARPGPRVSLQGLLVPGRHGEGACSARRGLSAGQLSLDDLGPRTFGRSRSRSSRIADGVGRGREPSHLSLVAPG